MNSGNGNNWQAGDKATGVVLQNGPGGQSGKPSFMPWPPRPTPPRYYGAPHRPLLLLGPPDYDPAPAHLAGVRLTKVVIEGPITGPTINGKGMRLSDAQKKLLDNTVSVWILDGTQADGPNLDPCNVACGFKGLEPVHVISPAGGHQYGPKGAPSIAKEEEFGPKFEASNAPHTIAVLDTSFEDPPDVVNGGLTGHGSFIAGIIKSILINADVIAVEIGDAGLEYNQELFGPDEPIVRRRTRRSSRRVRCSSSHNQHHRHLGSATRCGQHVVRFLPGCRPTSS